MVFFHSVHARRYVDMEDSYQEWKAGPLLNSGRSFATHAAVDGGKRVWVAGGRNAAGGANMTCTGFVVWLCF